MIRCCCCKHHDAIVEFHERSWIEAADELYRHYTWLTPEQHARLEAVNGAPITKWMRVHLEVLEEQAQEYARKRKTWHED